MKKIHIAFIFAFTLLFASCSQDLLINESKEVFIPKEQNTVSTVNKNTIPKTWLVYSDMSKSISLAYPQESNLNFVTDSKIELSDLEENLLLDVSILSKDIGLTELIAVYDDINFSTKTMTINDKEYIYLSYDDVLKYVFTEGEKHNYLFIKHTSSIEDFENFFINFKEIGLNIAEN